MDRNSPLPLADLPSLQRAFGELFDLDSPDVLRSRVWRCVLFSGTLAQLPELYRALMTEAAQAGERAYGYTECVTPSNMTLSLPWDYSAHLGTFTSTLLGFLDSMIYPSSARWAVVEGSAGYTAVAGPPAFLAAIREHYSAPLGLDADVTPNDDADRLRIAALTSRAHGARAGRDNDDDAGSLSGTRALSDDRRQ